MLDMLIKQMLPGLDIEAVQKQAIAFAGEVLQTVRRIEEKQDRILTLVHTLHDAQDRAQAATVPHPLTEGNQSHEQQQQPAGNPVCATLANASEHSYAAIAATLAGTGSADNDRDRDHGSAAK